MRRGVATRSVRAEKGPPHRGRAQLLVAREERERLLQERAAHTRPMRDKDADSAGVQGARMTSAWLPRLR